MSTKTVSSAAVAAALLSAFLVSSCGGAGDDLSAASLSANEPAKLATTDEVAILVGGFASFGALDFDIGSNSSGASSSAAKRRPMAKSFRPKATSTESCGSGNITFTDDTTTAFADDGLTTANNCRDTTTEGGSSFTSTINGKSSDKCTDSAQTTSNCNALTTRVADGAAGNATLDFGFSGGSGSERADFDVRFKADLSTTLSGNTDTTQFSGSIFFNDRVARLAGTALLENIRVAFTFNPSTGGGSETLSGAFGVSTGSGQCAVGKVSFRTDSPLIYNSNFDVTAGQLTLTGANGQTARVNYNSDSSYTVTLSNGQTRTYAADVFEELC